MTIRIVFIALLLGDVVVACRDPAVGGSSPPSNRPERPSAPVAPAIETDHPDHERTLPPLPSPE